MTHAEEAQLVQAYYGDSDDEVREHLEECAECRAAFQRVKELLDSLNEYPVPERGERYGAEVWSRVVPHLPLAKPRARWQLPWLWVPAVAAMLAIAFTAGLLTERHREPSASEKTRERVLLMAISAHLDRSQIVLAELVHASETDPDLSAERERARDLVTENRLLRASAAHMGDQLDANLLAELEPVLLEVANSPGALREADLHSIQQRIESQGLLFKVRVSGVDTRQKGQNL